jgi:cytochrome c
LMLFLSCEAASEEEKLEPGPDVIPFSQETVVEKLEDPMMFEILPDGSFLIIERLGQVKHRTLAGLKVVADFKVISHSNLENGKIVSASGFGGNYARECGLLGLAISPDFKKTGFVYVVYSPLDKWVNRLSRFTFKNKIWEKKSEKIILEVPHERKDKACHESGCLEFDSEGNLYWAIGDNTNPWGTAAGGAPQNEEDPINNAMRTSANSADLRGGIMRITPHKDGSYSIPNGNLFDDEVSRKEIYVKGCRNPFRISIDRKTNALYWGEVGPDAKQDTARGPKGYDEINRATQAGFYGWPFFVADNKPYKLWNFNTNKAIKAFDSRPGNPSKFNTGLKRLPEAQKAFMHYSYDKESIFGQGSRNAMAGPVIYQDASNGRLPNYLDSSLVIYDWMRGFLKFVKLSKEGEILSYHTSSKSFIHPIAVKQGKDGFLYVLEYGKKWTENKDGRILKLKFDKNAPTNEVSTRDPILTMMYAKQCMACHLPKQKSVGPSYADVARKYRSLKGQTHAQIKNQLRNKIKNGGTGVWGQIPMPPQPHVSKRDLDLILDYILMLE